VKKKNIISVKISSCRVSMTLHFRTYSFYRKPSKSNGDESNVEMTFNELREILT
jgi:hypothetical protein